MTQTVSSGPFTKANGFDSGLVHVWFVVGKLILAQGFFSECSSTSPPALRNLFNLSTIDDIKF